MTGQPDWWDHPEWGQRCPTCGHVRAPALRDCYCTHSILEHDITSTGARAKCLRGSCGCTQWRPNEETKQEE
jgi:hypothetical protein